MASMKIKPCPFCNSKQVKLESASTINDPGSQWWVTCYSCQAEGSLTYEKHIAIRLWNLPKRMNKK